MERLNKVKTIGEIGINANGDVGIAFQIIKAAAFAGFDYVKFQKRNPDKCVPEGQKSKIRQTPWGEMTYMDYKYKMEFNLEEYQQIDCFCQNNNIRWFASVWDLDSAEFMTQFTDIVKIPSALITHKGLLKYCRDNFRTVIISTGMSEEKEVSEAIDICNPSVVMHCCADYPAKSEDLNLLYMKYLRQHYGRRIGYSGHEEGLTTTFAAVAMGAEWIERHITLDHSMWGSDQRASIDPIGMIKLIKGIRDIESAMNGYGERKVLDCEKSKRESLRK